MKINMKINMKCKKCQKVNSYNNTGLCRYCASEKKYGSCKKCNRKFNEYLKHKIGGMCSTCYQGGLGKEKPLNCLDCGKDLFGEKIRKGRCNKCSCIYAYRIKKGIPLDTPIKEYVNNKGKVCSQCGYKNAKVNGMCKNCDNNNKRWNKEVYYNIIKKNQLTKRNIKIKLRNEIYSFLWKLKMKRFNLDLIDIYKTIDYFDRSYTGEIIYGEAKQQIEKMLICLMKIVKKTY